MSNVTELIARLTSATPTIAVLTFEPSVFGYDEQDRDEVSLIQPRFTAQFFHQYIPQRCRT